MVGKNPTYGVDDITKACICEFLSGFKPEQLAKNYFNLPHDDPARTYYELFLETKDSEGPEFRQQFESALAALTREATG